MSRHCSDVHCRVAKQICLHDARLLNMGRQVDAFVLILEMEPPARDLAILTFTVDGEPEITETALEGKTDSHFVTWMFEEWNIDRRRRPLFEVLLSNGVMVKLHFRDFQYRIMHQVNPNRNGEAAPSGRAMPQSA